MNIFRTKFWAVLCLYSVVVNTYAIDVGGVISSDTTWANTSEVYNITTPIQIAYGTTLTIAPGVKVAGGDIYVYGVLNISGTSQSKADLTDVHVIPGNNSPSEPYFISISHANLIDGSLLSPTGNGVYGSLLLQDSHLKDLKDRYGYNTFVHIWYPVSDVIIRRNIFDNFAGFNVGTSSSNADIIFENNHFKNFRTKYSSYADWGWVTCWNARNATVSISGSSFEPEGLNGYPAVSLEAGLDYASMIAVSNYWGTTVENEIRQMIYDKNDDLSCAGYIDYHPFLSAHHPDTPILGAEINILSTLR